MQALRPVLRRHGVRPFAKQPWGLGMRTQHDNYGPHKEYFQNPSQIPLPDTTPVTQPQAFANAQPQAFVAQPPNPRPQPSKIIRALRSVLWTILFGSLGVAGGTGLITWEYMQPPFAPGSEDEHELLHDIEHTLDTHSLVESLREEGWQEQNWYAGKAHKPFWMSDDHQHRMGLSLVDEKLVGIQGMSLVSGRVGLEKRGSNVLRAEILQTSIQ